MEPTTLFFIPSSLHLTEEEKAETAKSYDPGFISVPGKYYLFLNKILGEKRQVHRLYSFDAYRMTQSFYTLLEKRDYKEAIEVIKAKIHYADWFVTQDKCQTGNLIKSGIGYSISSFMHAVAYMYYDIFQLMTNPSSYQYQKERKVVAFRPFSAGSLPGLV